MSSPALPSRTAGNRNSSDSSSSSTKTPPIPTPRVSASIAKRWPPLANDSPVQPQPKSPTTVSTPQKPKPPAEPTPPSLPKRPAEPLPTPRTQEKGPQLPNRQAEPLPSLPSQSEAGPPLPRRPADHLPTTPSQDSGPPLPRRPAEVLPPVEANMQALASLVKSTTIPVLAVANGDLGPETFGQCLQSATDAIGKRHDDELTALESLRFHVFNRAKQDKAYAEELLKTNMRASKKAASVSDPSSPIFQVCFPKKLLMRMCLFPDCTRY